MFSARSPSRLSVPSLCLPFRFSFRSAFSCLPVLRVGWRGVGRCRRGAGRGVGSSGGWLLGRCGSRFLVSRGRSVCSIVSVSGAVSDVGRAVSGRSRLLASCSFSSHPVRFRPFLFISPRASSRLPVSLWRVGCRPVSRTACLVGRAVRRRSVACLPVTVVAGGAGDAVYLVPISSRYRFSLVRYGERGGGDVWRPVLLAWSRCRCHVRRPAVPVAVRLPVPMLVGAGDVG